MSTRDRSKRLDAMRAGRPRRPARRAAVAAALLALAPGAAPAEPPCVPGSIGPRGCASISPSEARTERPGVPSLDPDLEFDPMAELDARGATQPDGARQAGPGVLRLEPGARGGATVGRDPRAVQSFQTPYSFD